MNQLTGNITSINSQAHLSLVQVLVAQHTLQVLLIDTPQTAEYLQTGQNIELLFKETEVLLALAPLSGNISVPNQLPCTVQAIVEDTLLSKVSLDFAGYRITSVVTTPALQQMQLALGQQVVAMVKANEIMLAS
ncbi:TOBE domain-containing protein [Microscilla marina]|uniref:Tobe domain protein n=1 Tax=Microscilla marina ATCC 23134 TaxID=313606 RepID=A1ZQ06_MICM2|nr:TOBE domain-containing protein [Microscilla marina]EAY27415.1 tobe domain protein [Microscilla marina ATCC 23134]